MRYVGSCNTQNELSIKVYVPNETEDLNLSLYNMIAEVNESKSLKRISCECKYKIECNQNWNIKCHCNLKKSYCVWKIYFYSYCM